MHVCVHVCLTTDLCHHSNQHTQLIAADRQGRPTSGRWPAGPAPRPPGDDRQQYRLLVYV